MNRRTFTARISSLVLFLAAGGSSLLISGCNVFSDILSWVPVGEAALNSILTVLTGNGVVISPAVQAIISLIEAGFAALTAAVKEYQSATPPPAGALAKVEEAFKAIVDNFTTFLEALNVSGGLLSIITGLAQVVLSTIAAFMNRLPPSMTMKVTRDKLAGPVKVSSTTVTIIAKERNAAAFKKDFDAVLKSAPADVKVPTKAIL
jgi:hypothetical protein